MAIGEFILQNKKWNGQMVKNELVRLSLLSGKNGEIDLHPTSNTFIPAIPTSGTPTTVITISSSSGLPMCR